MRPQKRTSLPKTPKAKRKNWAKRIALTALGVFAVNSLAVAAGTPWIDVLHETDGKDAALIENWLAAHPDVSLTVAENISPSSLVQVPSTGTINLLGENNIYIAPPSQHGEWGIGYVLSHEYHHVQQLDLVQATTNMTPSIWNPVATAAHMGTLGALSLELNLIYGTDWHSTGGIEAAADCYSAWVEQQPVGYGGQGAYLHVNECSVEEVAASIAVSEGVWPSAENIEARLVAAEEALAGDSKGPLPSKKSDADKS